MQKEVVATKRTPSVPTPVTQEASEYSELQIKLEDYYQKPGEIEVYEISSTSKYPNSTGLEDSKMLKRIPSQSGVSTLSQKKGRVLQPQPPVSKKQEYSTKGSLHSMGHWEMRAPPLTTENFFHPRRGSLKRPSLQKPLPPISPGARSATKRSHPTSDNARYSAW